jgi:cell division protein DivIC
MKRAAFLKKNGFYVYSSLFLVIWLTFFDGANLITQFKLWLKLKNYKAQISYYDEELEKIKQQEKLLLNDMDALEKFGREKYLMKKDGETVFVIFNKKGEWLEGND